MVASSNRVSDEENEFSGELRWSSQITGNEIEDLWDMDASDVNPVDIVHGLRQNRFTYHTHPPLNLLNHSVAVSEYLKGKGEDEYTQLVGLLHDAHEAYTGDTIRPIKIMYPEIDELEMSIQDSVWDSFGIEKPSEELWSGVIDEGDQAVLVMESNKTTSNEELFDRICSYLDGHDVNREDVKELSKDIKVSRGREDAKRKFRNRLENLMLEVYGSEHLEAHYDEELMDEYQIPGGINADTRKKARDLLLVGADKLYHRFRNSMYDSGRSRRER